ncbi:hypothetical protein M409DRAFT_36863 [Zasmidium cellare ATCC 36951]|uniref:Intradiol ring-cleavage dioxygenases domain-containing protein n=1 Tax=Zasmidium cellare ATCC 36951 TaxID=1080233 RepID=A0A6A6CEU2_ZASCE|nr:uncharacterized protein M409DRAFT_36863 [Zasmidium cellare ATCC 36951]KAF2165734.1 hypothetical protein M409DRAFT_36863 [Zasmidium cellare ATCC 36951]
MKLSAILLLGLTGFSLAHPGHVESEKELIYKRNYNAVTRRGLSACAEQIEKRGINARAKARRAATFEKYRRSLKVRDPDVIANTSHLSTEGFTPNTPASDVFGESNNCVINPDGETGPFWVKGEHLRTNVRETQSGIPIVIEGQFLDIETCAPLTDVWWDMWSCNSTGVYSGAIGSGNGNENDLANINTTFLRGIQKTDSDGVATFESIFPGHYSGRATHHHIALHANATVLPNNTLTGGSFTHVGQLFWDQDIISKVEATYPYNMNNISITENAVDHVFTVETTNTTSDPVFNYAYLGDELADGLFGWITIVVNTSATYDPGYSFVLTEEGGIAQSGGSS